MERVDLGRGGSERITRFESEEAWSRTLYRGGGDAQVHVVHFDAGGVIGPHEAGYDQIFLVLEGAGWCAGPDGQRVVLGAGQAVLFRRGEVHSKGSEQGMSALMTQVRELLEA